MCSSLSTLQSTQLWSIRQQPEPALFWSRNCPANNPSGRFFLSYIVLCSWTVFSTYIFAFSIVFLAWKTSHRNCQLRRRKKSKTGAKFPLCEGRQKTQTWGWIAPAVDRRAWRSLSMARIYKAIIYENNVYKSCRPPEFNEAAIWETMGQSDWDEWEEIAFPISRWTGSIHIQINLSAPSVLPAHLLVCTIWLVFYL